MAKFSMLSKQRLSECDVQLQMLFTEVVKHFDCSIVCGYRGKDEQDEAFINGASQLRFPNSKHNTTPARAVDVIPFPTAYASEKTTMYFAGFVAGIAKGMNISIRWGGDWDRDNDLHDQTFNDTCHFELMD